MDEAKLAELERLAGATTPGPWHHDPMRLWACVTTMPHGMGACVAEVKWRLKPIAKADAAFIAAARTAVPELVAEIRRLRAIVAKHEDFDRLDTR